MSRVSEIRIKEMSACDTASVRKTINFGEEYGAFFGEALARIDAHLATCKTLAASLAMA